MTWSNKLAEFINFRDYCDIKRSGNHLAPDGPQTRSSIYTIKNIKRCLKLLLKDPSLLVIHGVQYPNLGDGTD